MVAMVVGQLHAHHAGGVRGGAGGGGDRGLVRGQIDTWGGERGSKTCFLGKHSTMADDDAGCCCCSLQCWRQQQQLVLLMLIAAVGLAAAADDDGQIGQGSLENSDNVSFENLVLENDQEISCTHFQTHL